MYFQISKITSTQIFYMYPYFSAGYHVSAGVSPVGNLVLLVLQCSLQNDALEQGLIWATELKHWATTFHESGCPGTTMFWGDLSSTDVTAKAPANEIVRLRDICIALHSYPITMLPYDTLPDVLQQPYRAERHDRLE